MRIRETRREDLKRIEEIYVIAREFMAAHGNPNQWGPTGWPHMSVIEEDIELGRSFVCVDDDDNVIGTFCYIYGKDIELSYVDIENGSWHDDSPYGVIHRIASDGTVKGTGTFCIRWALSQCGHMRIDTHTDNVTMQRLLENLGFEARGIIYVKEDNYPRIAYEKYD